MVHRYLEYVAMRMYPGGLGDSIDAGILGVVSAAGQCLQVWSAGVDVVADPGGRIDVVGSVRDDAVSFRGSPGVTSKSKRM
jgi:hypothetical protein